MSTVMTVNGASPTNYPGADAALAAQLDQAAAVAQGMVTELAQMPQENTLQVGGVSDDPSVSILPGGDAAAFQDAWHVIVTYLNAHGDAGNFDPAPLSTPGQTVIDASIAIGVGLEALRAHVGGKFSWGALIAGLLVVGAGVGGVWWLARR